MLAGGPDAVEDHVDALAHGVADHRRPAHAPHRPPDLAGLDHHVGAQVDGQLALLRVLGRGDEGAGTDVAAYGGDGAQADGARPEHDDGRRLIDPRPEGGVDRAGGRLDHHRRLVGHVVGDGVELALVRHHGRRPTTARVGAVADLQAGLELAQGEVLAAAGQAGGAERAGRVDPSGPAAEHRLDHDPAAVAVGDDLVARHERERHDRLEVAGRLPVDRGQVGAADPGQAGPDPPPARPGQVGLVDVGQAQRAEPGARPGRQPAGHHGRPVAGQVAAELEGAHQAEAPRRGARGSRGTGAPGALVHCSMCHPRLRAMAASLGSALTATGCPTASSIGRSLAESA